MKILFVLHAPKGIDGVGDYTATLANKLLEMGHHTEILGLSLETHSNEDIQRKKMLGIPLTQITWSPYSYESQNEARNFMKDFSPNWVSLQFVNYAWNIKGVVFSIIPGFKRLFAGLKLHIYFHEIWVGYFPNSTVKKKLMGYAQKISISLLARAMKPKIVHTNSSFQQQELEKIRINARRNPLFGNISYVSSPDFSWIYKLLQEWNGKVTPENRFSFTFIGLFGNLSEALINPAFYESLRKLAQGKSTLPVFLFIGILRIDGQKVFERMKQQFSEFSFLNFGQRPQKEISEFLQFVDFACATSPNHLVEKSGTFAALVEHAVPTLVFETNEGKGFRSILPSNARLFHLGDTFQQMPERKILPRTHLLDLHTRFFFDSLLLHRIESSQNRHEY